MAKSLLTLAKEARIARFNAAYVHVHTEGAAFDMLCAHLGECCDWWQGTPKSRIANTKFRQMAHAAVDAWLVDQQRHSE